VKLFQIIKKIFPEKFKVLITNNMIKRKYDVILKKGASAGRSTIFEGKNLLNINAQLYSSYIGFGTYVSGNSKLIKVKVGKYCSIGQNVKNYFGIHPSSDFVSTHPSFFSTSKQAGFTFVETNSFEEHKFVDENNEFVVYIGNDVWIGNDVSIMDGIIIGDGAIIATGAIVTKDVEAYTIVGGVPAKIIRKRFSEEEIELQAV